MREAGPRGHHAVKFGDALVTVVTVYNPEQQLS
jgi:uncharacterized membrane protein YhiD involved in acid resistance